MITEQATLDADRHDLARRAADHCSQASLWCSEEWATHAEAILEELIELSTPFTSEGITTIIGRPPSPGAVGGLIRRAAHAGRIVCIDYRPARRLQARGRILRVWSAA